MRLTAIQTIITILAIAFGTMLTRFTPFLLFPENKEPSKTILYLGKVLPPAMMGLLVVYCLKGVSFAEASHGIPEAAAIVCIFILHRWKSNVLLSIGGGTILYMFLQQIVFV